MLALVVTVACALLAFSTAFKSPNTIFHRYVSSTAIPKSTAISIQQNYNHLILFATKYKVTVQHGGKDTTIEVKDNESILMAALDAGIDLPHDCDLGVCLTCPSKIVSGKVDQTGGTLDDSVMAQGFALTCCSYPRSDVVIRSIDEDELVSAQFAREK